MCLWNKLHRDIGALLPISLLLVVRLTPTTPTTPSISTLPLLLLFTHIPNQCVSSSGGDYNDDWPIKNDSSGERERDRVNGDPSQSSLFALWSARLSGSDRIASPLFQKPLLLLRTQPPHPPPPPSSSSPPPPLDTSTHTPLQPENHRLGFWRLALFCRVEVSKLWLWWKAERRWWCWRREVSLARAPLICRKQSGAPCENRRGSRATGAAWAPVQCPIPGTGPSCWWRRAHGGICAPIWDRLARPPPKRDTGLIIPTKTAAAQTQSRTSTRKLMSAARLKAWTTQQLKVGARYVWVLHATTGFLWLHGGANEVDSTTTTELCLSKMSLIRSVQKANTFVMY